LTSARLDCTVRTRSGGGGDSKVALKCQWLSLPGHGKIVRAWLSHVLLMAAKNTEVTVRLQFSAAKRTGFGG
jgi:hypothetical protein